MGILAAGGGYGHGARACGTVADNLLSAQIVIASGEMVGAMGMYVHLTLHVFTCEHLSWWTLHKIADDANQATHQAIAASMLPLIDGTPIHVLRYYHI